MSTVTIAMFAFDLRMARAASANVGGCDSSSADKPIPFGGYGGGDHHDLAPRKPVN